MWKFPECLLRKPALCHWEPWLAWCSSAWCWACKAGRESIVKQIRLICFRTEQRAAGTGNSTMALSAPEMSQLLEAATRLFLFMCHSVIEESSSKALPKGTDIFVLSAAAFEAALPEAGGFELPEQLCWILSVQR